MTINKALDLRARVARLYLPREVGGRGMKSVENCINTERRTLGQHLKHNQDEWLTTA